MSKKRRGNLLVHFIFNETQFLVNDLRNIRIYFFSYILKFSPSTPSVPIGLPPNAPIRPTKRIEIVTISDDSTTESYCLLDSSLERQLLDDTVFGSLEGNASMASASTSTAAMEPEEPEK
ncbi:uncharacterized protein [Magallana gigas]|uniref:uncharacterized protein n=1 Tax=Magallana gigas TaxID=29159 RepID=UPI0033425739